MLPLQSLTRSCRRLAAALLLPLLQSACSAPPPPPDPAEPLSLYLRGRIASGLREPELARQLLLDAALLAPDCASIQLALSQAHRALADEPAAERALDRALALAPKDPTANLMRARDELARHQLEPALRRLLALAASEAPPLEAYELLHPLLLWSGEVARGIELFDRARERLPAHAFVHEARADFLACLGREAEALDSYRRALALDPRRHSAERKAARLLEEQGDRLLRKLVTPVDPGFGLATAPNAAADDR